MFVKYFVINYQIFILYKFQFYIIMFNLGIIQKKSKNGFDVIRGIVCFEDILRI